MRLSSTADVESKKEKRLSEQVKYDPFVFHPRLTLRSSIMN